MRNTTVEIDNSVNSAVVRTLTMVRIDFDDDIIAWSNSFADIVYDGVTFLGAGTLSSVTVANEEAGFKPSTVNVSLSGIPTEIVALLLSEPYLGRKGYIYEAFVDESFIFDPLRVKKVFAGTIFDINGAQGETASFSISIKSRLSDWERTRNLLYTDSDQQKLYPGDKFMEFIPQISKMKLIWPKAAALVDPRD